MRENAIETILQMKIRDEEIKSRISDDLLMSLSEDELQKILFRWLQVHRIDSGFKLEPIEKNTTYTFRLYERYGKDCEDYIPEAKQINQMNRDSIQVKEEIGTVNNYKELEELLQKLCNETEDTERIDKLVAIMRIVSAANKELPKDEKEKLHYMAEGIITEATGLHLEENGDLRKIIVTDQIRRNAIGEFNFRFSSPYLFYNNYRIY